MELPAQRWHEALERRGSRRRFQPAAPAQGLLHRLDALCREFRPFGAVRAVLLRQAPPDLFRGVLGAYGSVKGAPCCLVVAGSGARAAEAGYVGEGAVLEATALWLGTCWVAGLFRPESLGGWGAGPEGLGEGERVWAVSPVGTPAPRKTVEERLMGAVARSGTRKGSEGIAPGSAGWPEWARAGVEAARRAPSALNRQPWRFSWEGGRVVLGADGPDTHGIPKRLDCGIAMLHFEVGARWAGRAGRWRMLPDPLVAEFVPE
ncbi:MAG: nitroreductase family protein [Deferrisomatales bacterium]|nr:nitroreductase family protein [Deferrisomatales bacterium]